MGQHGKNGVTRVHSQLTQQDISIQIRAVAEEILKPAAARSVDGDAATAPRWIDAAELVRRLRPFLGSN